MLVTALNAYSYKKYKYNKQHKSKLLPKKFYQELIGDFPYIVIAKLLVLVCICSVFLFPWYDFFSRLCDFQFTYYILGSERLFLNDCIGNVLMRNNIWYTLDLKIIKTGRSRVRFAHWGFCKKIKVSSFFWNSSLA